MKGDAERTGPLQGRFVHLRPLSESDAALVYDFAVDPRSAHRWFFRGETPTRNESFELTLRGALASFVVVTNSTNEEVGLVIAQDPDITNQRVSLAVIHAERFRRLGWPLEGTALAIDWLFSNWPFRKVTAMAMEYSSADFRHGARDIFRLEARLEDVVYWQDRWWSMDLLAIRREEWAAFWGKAKGYLYRGIA